MLCETVSIHSLFSRLDLRDAKVRDAKALLNDDLDIWTAVGAVTVPDPREAVEDEWGTLRANISGARKYYVI